MKFKTLLTSAFAGMAMATFGLDNVRVDGAKGGEWTHDLDAAKAFARESGRYLFVDFTGSDWCGWCQLMDKHVFTQPGWQAFAAKHLSLAYIDTPRNADLVPEKYRARNAALRKEYEIRGFPTYLLFAPDGHTVGRLSTMRGGTDMGFVTNVVTLIVEDRIADFVTVEESAEYKSVGEELKALEVEHRRVMDEFRTKKAEPYKRKLQEIDNGRREILKRAKADEGRKGATEPPPAHDEIKFASESDRAEYDRLFELENSLQKEWAKTYDAFIADVDEYVNRRKPLDEKRARILSKAWCAENGIDLKTIEQ